MDDKQEPGRGGYWVPVIAVLAIAGVVLVALGRILDAGQYPGWQDPFYSIFLAFTLDGTFLGEQNAVTLAGALAAGLATYIALVAGALSLSRRHITAWRAARLRDHIVVVGDDADASELAALLGKERNVILASRHGTAPRGVVGIWRPPAAAALLAAANIGRAHTVAVMLADERRDAVLATSLASARGDAASPVIWCRASDRVLADRLSAADAGPSRIEVFDDADLMAREAFARHPAHALAECMGANRVHLLVAGFGGLGQAMAEEAIFSGIAHGLEKPMVTVLDRDAARAEALYRALRPSLGAAADFAFIEADLVTTAIAPRIAQAAFDALAQRDDVARVTAIALCLPEDADNVRLALALPELRRREGRYFAPAFMRMRDEDASRIVLSAAAPHVVDPNQGVIPLQRAARLLATMILDSARRDQAARALHEAYGRHEGRSGAASARWEHLPETYRRANRRGADHIAAKLATLGLTAERDPHAPAAVRRAAHAQLVAPLLAGDGERLEHLAALEHRRWSADRIVDGWSYAARRDDDRKQHPLLETGDYSRLPPAEQQKDRDQIRTVLSSVAATDGPGAMLETRLALAGHRNLTPEELARGVAAAIERLAGRLAAADRAVTLVSPLAPGADMALVSGFADALVGKVGELRLIVPEAVPYRVVLEVAAREEGGDDPSRAAFVEQMLAERRALFARFARVDIVRMGFAGCTDDSYRRDQAQFESGLAGANAYLARRADLLAVLWDGRPGRGLGGTADLVAYWRDPTSIPPEIDVPPSPLRGLSHSEESLVAVTVDRG